MNQEVEQYLDNRLIKISEDFVKSVREPVIDFAKAHAKAEQMEVNNLHIEVALATLGLAIKEEVTERKENSNGTTIDLV